MRFRRPALMLVVALCGCDGRPESDQVIPIDQVPASVMTVAHKELPGYTFDTVYKMKVDSKDAYAIRGRNKRGKTREVEVSATGEVLAIE